ncbi:MAG: GIY-YIG nuclease family protein [Fibrobacter sp.]|nr:GIY-YIG nuclease family protein [Fibrobacter sp.]
MNEYYVYMMASSNNNALYIGLTNDIRRRYEEHCSGNVTGFTQKYKVHKLVYLEQYTEVNDAIAREKQLKGWSRAKKNVLVNGQNPLWNDLMQGEV